MRTNEKLIKVMAYKDFINGRFYLELLYEYTDEKGKHTLIYPKVTIPFDHYRVPYIRTNPEGELFFDCDDRMYILCETSTLATSMDYSEPAYFVDVVTEPAEAREMTLEEIEKKLGCKVKIVNTEGNENDKT